MEVEKINLLKYLNESNINENAILQRIVYKSENTPLFIISCFDPYVSYEENLDLSENMIQFLRRTFNNLIDIFKINRVWKDGTTFDIENGHKHYITTGWLMFLPEGYTEEKFEKILRDLIYKYRQKSYLVKDPHKSLFIQTREGKLIKNIGPLTLANLKLGLEEHVQFNLQAKKIYSNVTFDHIVLSMPFKISADSLF